MSLFLAEVAQRHADEFVLMVMDQAGWHLAGELVVPQNVRLLMLPPYSPELNPAEHLWDAIREDCFANHVFANLDAVESALTTGLCQLEADPGRARLAKAIPGLRGAARGAMHSRSPTAREAARLRQGVTGRPYTMPRPTVLM